MGKEYLNNDLRTLEGRSAVTECNGCLEQWKPSGVKEKDVHEQINYILKLLATGNMKDNLYFGAVEGMHMLLADVWSLNRSAPDNCRGIVASGGLSTQDFARYKIVGEKVPPLDTFNNCIDMALASGITQDCVFDKVHKGVICV